MPGRIEERASLERVKWCGRWSVMVLEEEERGGVVFSGV